ncbi:MAG: PAAR domain-containing protein [Pseudomonadota bacterium]
MVTKLKKIIRLGDPTSHGGKVVSVKATHFTVDGIPVACVDDVCICPFPGHANCRIVSGSADHEIDGRSVAFQDDKTSCGASLISTCASYEGT